MGNLPRELPRIILADRPGVWWLDVRLNELRSCDPNNFDVIRFNNTHELDECLTANQLNARPLAKSGLDIGVMIKNGEWKERTPAYGWASNMLDQEETLPSTPDEFESYVDTLRILMANNEPNMPSDEEIREQLQLAINDLKEARDL